MLNYSEASTANKDRSTVNYRQSLAFYHSYLLYNGHCDRWLFQVIFFFVNFIFISKKFFWTVFNLFSWNLNTFTKHKEQSCFSFICSFFTCCFVIILCIYASTFSYFPTAWKHTRWVCSLFYCFYAITPCNNTLQFLYLDRFIKTSPSSMSILSISYKFS